MGIFVELLQNIVPPETLDSGIVLAKVVRRFTCFYRFPGRKTVIVGLAYGCSLVTRGLQGPCKGRPFGIEVPCIAKHTQFLGVEAGDKRRPGWLADGALAPGSGESGPLPGDPIEIRCLHQGMAGAPHDIVAMLITEDEEYVGFLHSCVSHRVALSGAEMTWT